MSAFIVDTDTMHRCIAGVLAVREDLPHVAPTLAKLVDDPLALASALYALNESAVLQRYPGDPDFSATPRYNHKIALCSKVAAYKALRCLRYQCSEGEADKSPLYAELTAVIGSLAEAIVSALPEYARAAWG